MMIGRDTVSSPIWWCATYQAKSHTGNDCLSHHRCFPGNTVMSVSTFDSGAGFKSASPLTVPQSQGNVADYR